MFRRLRKSLPEDFKFPADLRGLGYFVNEHDQIRSVENPSQEFHYFISKNERCLEVHREAINLCIRQIVFERLLASSLTITRLPLGASATGKHVPILTSSHLSTAKRIIIYIGESLQDLGIFAYRVIGQDSIASGSAIDFVNNVKSSSRDDPGLIIANPGQLLWYCRGKQAVSQSTWNALPSKTAVTLPMKPLEAKNRIQSNYGLDEHVSYIFDKAVGNLVNNKEVTINIIAIGDGGLAMFDYLNHTWDKWADRVQAIAVGSSHIWRPYFLNTSFKEFWGKRARAFMISSEPLDTPLTGRDDFGCNCYSSGEPNHVECIMPRAHTSMVRYFKVVHENPNYEVDPQNFPKEEIVQEVWRTE